MPGLIHKHSAVCAKSELDLLFIPPTQMAIEKVYFVEYHLLTNIHDGVLVEFKISENENVYINFPRLSFMQKGKSSNRMVLPERI